MIIIGVDYHPSVQQIAYVDTETGETCERRLNHSDGEAEHFYRALERRQVRVRVAETSVGTRRESSSARYSASKSWDSNYSPQRFTAFSFATWRSENSTWKSSASGLHGEWSEPRR